MHDGIYLEKANLPAAAVATDAFKHTALAMAATQGVPDYPAIYIHHPISNQTREQLHQRAEAVADQIVSVLTLGRV